MLALALVFGVLLAEFRNFAAPISILTSSVLSLAGVVFALLITGTGFNVASFMGLIMVIGIVAKNGILLLDADEQLRASGLDARQAMLHAAERRRRPILMTAIATVCGMFPLALALGAGSQMLQPLAIAVIGGLSLSIVLSLVVTPVVYYHLTRRRLVTCRCALTKALLSKLPQTRPRSTVRRIHFPSCFPSRMRISLGSYRSCTRFRVVVRGERFPCRSAILSPS